MIETEKRKAIFLLHQEGMSVRQIARRLGVSRNTVDTIIEQQGATPQTVRSDKQRIDPELLRQIYHQCDGWVQRVWEKLNEEHGIAVKYSTLTRMLRELGISNSSAEQRCSQVPDQPGAEMQHDTSSYLLTLGQSRVRVTASLLYLRYSKRRYLKFYPFFDRFKMKCFFHQALMFWGYAPPVCIIDNTNLARLFGLGKDAVIVPEMAAFAKQYGFRYSCHARGHSDRKAGEERSFFTVETNFFPGRTFENFEDLNQQALQWATVRLEQRPQGKAGLIPAQAFEHERTHLTQLPAHLPAPYRILGRGTDQYGYVAFEGNYYWVPGTRRDDVKLLQFAERLQVYRNREFLAEYPLPPVGVHNQKFGPQGQPAPPSQPKDRHHPTQEEEQRLRALDPSVGAYLDFALKLKGLARHRFLRQLFALSRKLTGELFLKTIQRAAKYQITDSDTLWRIALLQMTEGAGSLPLPQIDEAFQERETYQQGSLTEQPDLSLYDQFLDPDPDQNHE